MWNALIHIKNAMINLSDICQNHLCELYQNYSRGHGMLGNETPLRATWGPNPGALAPPSLQPSGVIELKLTYWHLGELGSNFEIFMFIYINNKIS